MYKVLSMLLMTLLVGYHSFVAAESQVLQSPATQVALLELYTSEGCSSCPPADRWLSRLKDDSRLWHELVPVAFHVDYWDYLGWQDRFATPTYGARQRAYRAAAAVRSVYTPGFVLAGQEWRRWFVQPELQLEPVTEAPVVGRIRLEINPDSQQVLAQFVPSQPWQQTQAAQLHLALLGFELSSVVNAGENRGRELNHDFVVLAHQRMALNAIQGSGGSVLQATLAMPAAKLQLSQSVKRKALAGWVSAANDPRPLQAVGGWLSD